MSASLELFPQLGLFDVHISELTGIEHVAAFEALDKFAIFVAGDYADARVLTISHWILSGNQPQRD